MLRQIRINFLPVILLFLILVFLFFLKDIKVPVISGIYYLIGMVLFFLVFPILFPLYLGVRNYQFLKANKNSSKSFTFLLMFLAVITLILATASLGKSSFGVPKDYYLGGNLDLLFVLTGHIRTWVTEDSLIAHYILYIGTLVTAIVSSIVFLLLKYKK